MGALGKFAGFAVVAGLIVSAFWAACQVSMVVGGFAARGSVSGLPEATPVALVPVDAEFAKGPGAEPLEARLAKARKRGAKVAAILLEEGSAMFPKSRLEAVALRSFARGKAGLPPDPEDERWLAGYGSASKVFEASPRVDASRLEIASAFAPFGWMREPARPALAESDFDEEAKDIWGGGVGAAGFGLALFSGIFIAMLWWKVAETAEKLTEAAEDDVKRFETEMAAKEIEACCAPAVKGRPKRL